MPDRFGERATDGRIQIVGDAVRSWQIKLNQQANCKTLYGFTSTPEATQTTQLESGDAGGAAGLAFTNIPIGSEAGRETGTQVPSPVPVAYAPVAISAITMSFNINIGNGYLTTPIKLTPRLVAKALTQSYLLDMPGVLLNQPTVGPVPAWAQKNPAKMTLDPEFLALNPEIPPNTGTGTASSFMDVEDHSALNQQLWQWVLADPTAKAWLQGTPDQWGMAVNPNYTALGVGSAALDSFPRADPTCLNTGQAGIGHQSIRCSLDMLPYVDDFETVAADARASFSPLGAGWDPNKAAPDGSIGWWGNGTVISPGFTYLWGMTDTPSSATFGLVAAALCDSSGANCVTPSDQSVGAAVSAATPDSSGLLDVNPAGLPSGAYPLVDVTYAAVRTDDDPAAIADYTTLIQYASTTGQTPGEAPGQLPRGYLPLTDSLKAQAAQVVTQLQGITGATTTPTPTANSSAAATSGTLGDSTTELGGTLGGETEATGGGGVAGGQISQPPGPHASVAATSVSPGPATVISGSGLQPSLQSTAAQPVSAARYAPIGVIIGGVSGLIGLPIVRRIGRRRATGR